MIRYTRTVYEVRDDKKGLRFESRKEGECRKCRQARNNSEAYGGDKLETKVPHHVLNGEDT